MSNQDLRELLEKTAARRFSQWKGYALSITRNEADAEEVVQEAIAKTLRAEPDMDTEERVHKYMQRAIRNTAFSLIDKRQRFVQVDDPEDALPPSLSALEVMLNDENEFSKKRLARALVGKLAELDEHHREVVENLVMRSPRMKLREMAELQGVTTSTVHYRLQTALKKLLELVLEDEGLDP